MKFYLKVGMWNTLEYNTLTVRRFDIIPLHCNIYTITFPFESLFDIFAEN